MSRRLFEQSENTNPDLSQRLGFGRASAATENMTLTNFITWIQGKLSFLLKSQNLNDIPNKTYARTNLGVYSTSTVNTLVAGKADKYPTSGGALKTTNVTSFVPTNNYHPATKKYVDDNSLIPLFKGYINLGDAGSGETTVAFSSVGTSTYMVVGDMVELGSAVNCDVTWQTRLHATTSFVLGIREFGGYQNLRFNFMIYAASDFTNCTP